MNQSPDLPVALEDRSSDNARMSSPSAQRNQDVIAMTLSELLPPNSKILEIASGTGEHALACVKLRTDLIWQPSEYDPQSRLSVDAWARDGAGRIKPCLDISTMDANWADGLEAYDGLFCANMIHIAPFEAAIGLFAGAASVLKPSGEVHLYGPFKLGADTAPSNLEFDQSLKSRHSSWGVREIDDIDKLAKSYGFMPAKRRSLPANNFIMSFARMGS